MTRIQQHQIQCSCGHEFSVRLYESVNTQLSPDAVGDFLGMKLNRPECPECHKQLWVMSPVLFNDMEREFMVWVGAGSQPDGRVHQGGRGATIIYARNYLAALAALVVFRLDPENASIPYDQMSTAKANAFVASYLRIYEHFRSDNTLSSAAV